MSKVLATLLKTSMVSDGKQTFYNSKDDQLANVIAQHIEALTQDRQRYAMLSLMPLNDQAKTLILRGLLATGRARTSETEELEWDLILEVARDIPISRFLRFYCDVISRKNAALDTKPLNNARAKRLGRHLWHQATPYQVIKYAGKFKRILTHCHIGEQGLTPTKLELYRWLSGDLKRSEGVVVCRELKDRLRAKEGDTAALYRLPLDVAQGIALSRGIAKETFAADYAQRTTVASKRERFRAATSSSGQAAVNWRDLDLMDLVRYGRDHQDAWGQIYPVIQEKAEAINLAIPEGVGVVVDCSLSMIGAGDRRGYPIAFAETVMRLFLGSATPVQVFLTNPVTLSRPLMAKGATDLRLSVAKAIQAGCQHIVILSDGYENQGSVGAIAAQPAVKQAGIKFYHINPVAAVEATTTRAFCPEIEPITISGLTQLPVASFLKTLEQNPTALTQHLDRVYHEFSLGNPVAAKRIATFKDQPISLLGGLSNVQ